MSSLGPFLVTSVRPHPFLTFAQGLGMRLGASAAFSADLKCQDSLISRSSWAQ